MRRGDLIRLKLFLSQLSDPVQILRVAAKWSLTGLLLGGDEKEIIAAVVGGPFVGVAVVVIIFMCGGENSRRGRNQRGGMGLGVVVWRGGNGVGGARGE